MGNLIDRELLIKKLDEHCNTVCQYPKSIREVMCGGCPLGTAFDVVGEMPSAEPEPLTDKEQRIFLAAMGREEKVCKQVDDECRDCMESYEDSLVRTCHEITRKVKGALWT